MVQVPPVHQGDKVFESVRSNVGWTTYTTDRIPQNILDDIRRISTTMERNPRLNNQYVWVRIASRITALGPTSPDAKQLHGRIEDCAMCANVEVDGVRYDRVIFRWV